MIQVSTLEKKIAAMSPQSEPVFADQLYEQALNLYVDTYHTEVCKKRHFRHYAYTAAASAIMVLLIIFVFTPPGQVLAQKIFQFGWFIFTDEPTQMERLITATPQDVVTLQSNQLDVQAASELVGFPVYSLTHIPDGYQVSARNPQMPVEIVYNQAGNVMNINTMYFNSQSELILSFIQIPMDVEKEMSPIRFPVGDTEPQFVQVGETEGVWLEDFIWGAKPDETGDLQTVPYNLLIWQVETEDGQLFQFWLGSEEQLSLDVMQEMAESIEKWGEF